MRCLLKVLPTLLLAVVSVFWVGLVYADISNPHPVPPSNSVTTAMLQNAAVTPAILDGSQVFSMLGLDLGTTTASAGVHITASTTRAVFYVEGGPSNTNGPLVHIQSSSTEAFRITRDGKVGIGSSSPSVALGVTGSALISATGTMKDLAVTGTMTLGKVRYTPPATDGTVNQVLQTNGSGALSFGSGSDWIECLDVIATTSEVSLDLPLTGSTASEVHIIMDLVCGNNACDPQFQLNGDFGANYRYQTSKDNAVYRADTADYGTSILALTSNDILANKRGLLDFWLNNGSTTQKTYRWTFNSFNTPTPLNEWRGFGMYMGTSSITNFQFNMVTPNTFAAGTRFMAWCKKN